MKRRTLIAAGVAAAAGALGAGLALWQGRRDSMPALPAEFWSLRFAQPAGGELAFAALRGKPLLLNFWATWCAPCLTEMPMLDAFERAQRAGGWQVVGLAVDTLEPVREYLRRRPVEFAIGMAGFEGVELARQLGNADGGLPFTVVIDRAGQPAHRKLGALKTADLERWAASLA